MERPTSKTRRHQGRVHNKFYDPEKGAYNEYHWDDWKERRDGLRDTTDKKLIKHEHSCFSEWNEVKRFNTKLKKLINRRKLRKNASVAQR